MFLLLTAIDCSKPATDNAQNVTDANTYGSMNTYNCHDGYASHDGRTSLLFRCDSSGTWSPAVDIGDYKCEGRQSTMTTAYLVLLLISE